MKTWHWILIVVGVFLVGFLVYWFGFRSKKSLVPPVHAQPPVQNSGIAQQILGFAFNEGKKYLSDRIEDYTANRQA